MKVLLLNQTFYPDVASTAQHLADLALELGARGHQVTVVTGRRAYDDARTLFAKEETWRGVHILRIGSTSFGKETKWRRTLDFASFMALSCLRVAFLTRHDVIVALTSPPLISLLGLCLARWHRSRFVYWVMDLNPDEAVAAGWLRAESALARLLEWISRLTLRHADQVIALDRFMFNRIAAKGIPSAQISVLPPWSHDAVVRFDAVGRERFRKQHGLDGKFVVMYSGNHSPCHPLDIVLEAARQLAHKKDVIFCFIGGGTEFRRIKRMVGASKTRRSESGGNSGSLRILCLPYQALDELSASLSAADVHLVVMGNAFVGLVHPCKIYNILRIGAPLIYVGPKPSPASEILAEADGQLVSACVGYGDTEGLVRQIERVRRDSRNRARACDLDLCARFSKERILPRLIAQLENSKLGALRM